MTVLAFVLGVLANVVGGFGFVAVAAGTPSTAVIDRKLQIVSSSPKLVAITPGGTHVLKRGNPFEGRVGNVDEVLSAAVRHR